MSRQLSDVLEMYRARGPQLRDVGQYVQQPPPTMMRGSGELVKPATRGAVNRPTTLDAINAKSAMTHYADDPRPNFPDTTGRKSGDLSSYLRLIKGLLVGEPEKLLSGETSQIGDAEGMSFSYPTGLPDALAALPMFGGIMRAGKAAAKPFFSGLARMLSERAPAIGTAEHFLNVARKGGKAEELAWTGLEDWLKSQPGKLRKDDVLKYVDDNVPELREKMIAAPKKVGGPNAAMVISDQITQPKFTNWTLPGGENHRELVVTMPPKVKTGLRAFGPDGYADDVFDTEEEARQYIRKQYGPDAARENIERVQLPIDSMSYNVPVGHAYNDPELDVNRLFHVRMNDRVVMPSYDIDEIGERIAGAVGAKSMDSLASGAPGVAVARGIITPEEAGAFARAKKFSNANEFPVADGRRALHMEELQSDWHQAGKREGYGGQKRDLQGEQFDLWLDSQENRDLIIDEYREYEKEVLDGDDMLAMPEWVRENYGDVFPETIGVPDAPFKKTWERLGMKRMLQEAVDGNYDRLTWTTGAQQADRYSLAKHVDRLRYDPATQELTGYKSRAIGPIITQKVAPADLPDYIGREAADKLLATTPGSGRLAFHEISGQDLKLGGEGMKAAYDVRLPNIANDLGKKYGVKTEKVDIGGGQITADNIRSLASGSGRRNDIIHEVARQVEEMGKQPLDALKDIRAILPKWRSMPGERIWGMSGQDYNAIRKQLMELPKNNQLVWSLEITPEMRRDLMEQGQPLFNVSPPVPLPRYDEKNKTTRDLSMWPAH